MVIKSTIDTIIDDGLLVMPTNISLYRGIKDQVSSDVSIAFLTAFPAAGLCSTGLNNAVVAEVESSRAVGEAFVIGERT